MMHKSITRDLLDKAALHALGLLEPEQAVAWESHLSMCDVCRSEFQRFHEAAAQFAFEAAMEPSPDLRARVLAAIENSHDEIAIIRNSESTWADTPFPGVAVKALYEDPVTRNITQLVRLTAGACYPPHRHVADEQCYVITGDVKIGGDVFGPGDFTVAVSGSDHGGVSTRNGCLLLIVASPNNQVLAST